MPMGSLHDETGLLLTEGRSTILQRDAGGRWRLDLGWRCGLRARRLLGRRVRVVGVRDGFDLLAAERVEAV